MMRDAGYEMVASWISGGAEPTAQRRLAEIHSADVLLLYCEDGDISEDAILAVGAALAVGVEVRCVGWGGRPAGVFRHHPQWRDYDSIGEAVADGFHVRAARRHLVNDAEVEKALRIMRVATDEATDRCGLVESVTVLISQRDNARHYADTFRKKLAGLGQAFV